MFFKGEWGTVCDPELIAGNFDYTYTAHANTKVICRHLGFSGGSMQKVSSTDFGTGRGKVWLSKLRCEEHGVISDCVVQWGNKDSQCEDHSHDLAVRCNGR